VLEQTPKNRFSLTCSIDSTFTSQPLLLFLHQLNFFTTLQQKLFEVPKDTFEEKKVTLTPLTQDKDIFSLPIKHFSVKSRQLGCYFLFIRFAQKKISFFREIQKEHVDFFPFYYKWSIKKKS